MIMPQLSGLTDTEFLFAVSVHNWASAFVSGVGLGLNNQRCRAMLLRTIRHIKGSSSTSLDLDRIASLARFYGVTLLDAERSLRECADTYARSVTSYAYALMGEARQEEAEL